MLWLLTIGLIHAYVLLWSGSILFEYAICGLLLFSLRNLSSKHILFLSFSVLGFYMYINSRDYNATREMFKGYEKALALEKANKAIPKETQKQKDAFENYLDGFPPFSESRKEEMKKEELDKIKLYTSSLTNVYRENHNSSTESLSLGVYLYILETIGTMLLGMGMLKLGFFEYKLKKQIYLTLLFLGIPTGVIFYYLLHQWRVATQSELLTLLSWKMFSSESLELTARIMFSLSYCSFFVLLSRLSYLEPILQAVRNVGKMAFTNYVAQTFICVTYFYLLKFYGSINMVHYSIFSISIITFQLVGSYFCIRLFKQGPLEFIWRKLAKSNLPN